MRGMIMRIVAIAAWPLLTSRYATPTFDRKRKGLGGLGQTEMFDTYFLRCLTAKKIIKNIMSCS